MTTYDSLVARLTLAVDHDDDDDNPATPDVDGNAAQADEPGAQAVLERLVAAYTGLGAPDLSPPPTTTSYAARVAAWQAGSDQTYAACDRSARALMTLIQSLAPRYPSSPTDFRGNPIPVERRGAIFDPGMRALDPIAVPPDGVNADGLVRPLVHMLQGLSAGQPTALRCRLQCRDRRRPGLRECPHEANARAPCCARYLCDVGREDAYSQAKASAEAFVAYLDAIATPDGVP